LHKGTKWPCKDVSKTMSQGSPPHMKIALLFSAESLMSVALTTTHENTINYHPQSGWFEDTPLKGGTEQGYPLKGV